MLAGACGSCRRPPRRPRRRARRRSRSGWEVRSQAAAPRRTAAAPRRRRAQPEDAPAADAASAADRARPRGRRLEPGARSRACSTRTRWRPSTRGEVRRYRLDFTGPPTPARLPLADPLRGASAGRRGLPERPPARPQHRPLHALHARGARPAAGPDQPRSSWSSTAARTRDLPEGWWNWGGIVRPVHLDPGRPRPPRTTSARCRRSAAAGRRAGCKAPRCCSTACSSARRQRSSDRRSTVELRSPPGPDARAAPSASRPQRGERQPRCDLPMPVPAPVPLVARATPQLYRRGITLRDRGVVQQVDRRTSGCARSTVKHGHALPQQPPRQAARRLDPRGHARPRRRAHRRGHGHDRQRPEGARRQRHARALPAQRPAPRRARPRRDHGLEPVADLAARPPANSCSARSSASARWATVRADRDGGAQPPVGDHPLGRQRAVVDARTSARHAQLFLDRRRADRPRPRPDAADLGRHQAAPRLPRAVHLRRTSTCSGINQYFGWYRWVPELRRPRALPPARCATSTRAGARDDRVRRRGAAGAGQRAGRRKGQLRLPGRLHRAAPSTWSTRRRISGAIYWTLREFEIYPGWTRRRRPAPAAVPAQHEHHKGLLTYDGVQEAGLVRGARLLREVVAVSRRLGRRINPSPTGSMSAP